MYLLHVLLFPFLFFCHSCLGKNDSWSMVYSSQSSQGEPQQQTRHPDGLQHYDVLHGDNNGDGGRHLPSSLSDGAATTTVASHALKTTPASGAVHDTVSAYQTWLWSWTDSSRISNPWHSWRSIQRTFRTGTI